MLMFGIGKNCAFASIIIEQKWKKKLSLDGLMAVVAYSCYDEPIIGG